MYSCAPSEGERYYLRLLLLHVPGATSYEHLRTVEAEGKDPKCASFREAAQRRGLIDDDSEYDNAMAEAALVQSPPRLREFFALLLLFCELSDPAALWQKHAESMCHDFLQRGLNEEHAADAALAEIEERLQRMDRRNEEQHIISIAPRVECI